MFVHFQLLLALESNMNKAGRNRKIYHISKNELHEPVILSAVGCRRP